MSTTANISDNWLLNMEGKVYGSCQLLVFSINCGDLVSEIRDTKT